MVSEDLQDLIRRIALNRDQHAFEQLYFNYYKRLTGLALSIVKSQESAEEIYNDVMLNIWESNETLLNISNLTVYLYVSVKNLSIRHLNKISRLQLVNLEDVKVEIRDFSPSAQDKLISAEFLESVNQAIEQLSPQCRLVFKLVKEDGLKYREVAEILEISVKNVEYHMGNALKKISHRLSLTKRTFVKGSFLSINSN